MTQGGQLAPGRIAESQNMQRASVNSMQSIIRQAEQYPRVAGGRQITWTPEEKELMAELKERLDYKLQTGDLPRRDVDSPDFYTDALQEMILMRREREESEGFRSEDYDKSYNDWEAGE